MNRLDKFWNDHHQRALKICSQIVGNLYADDVCLIAWEKCYKTLDDTKQTKQWWALFKIVCIHESINWLKKEKRIKTFNDNFKIEDFPYLELTVNQSEIRIESLPLQLSPSEQLDYLFNSGKISEDEILLLKWRMDNMKQKDMAVTMKVSISTIKRRMKDTMKKARIILNNLQVNDI